MGLDSLLISRYSAVKFKILKYAEVCILDIITIYLHITSESVS